MHYLINSIKMRRRKSNIYVEHYNTRNKFTNIYIINNVYSGGTSFLNKGYQIKIYILLSTIEYMISNKIYNLLITTLNI